MEVRNWVLGVITGHLDGLPPGTLGNGRPLQTSADALACLRHFALEGNWSTRQEDGHWRLYTGDQWVGAAEDKAEFDAFTVGAAVAVALLRDRDCLHPQ
jgi:hypothetical protein